MYPLAVFSASCLISLLTCAGASAGSHNANAIKFGPAAASASPDVLPQVDVGEQNLAIDTAQVSYITDQLRLLFFLLCMLMFMCVLVLMVTFPTSRSLSSARLTLNVVARSSASFPVARAFSARSAESAAHGTPCAALATTATMVR